MTKPRKVQTGVSMDPDLLDYVDSLAERDDPVFRRRPRSQIIALIIEEHAKRNGNTPEKTKLQATA